MINQFYKRSIHTTGTVNCSKRNQNIKMLVMGLGRQQVHWWQLGKFSVGKQSHSWSLSLANCWSQSQESFTTVQTVLRLEFSEFSVHDQHLLVWFNRWRERVKRRWWTRKAVLAATASKIFAVSESLELYSCLALNIRGCPWVWGLARPPIPRRGTAPAHRSGDGSNSGDISHPWGCDNQWAFNRDAHQPWWYMESLLVSAGGWGASPRQSLNTFSMVTTGQHLKR